MIKFYNNQTPSKTGGDLARFADDLKEVIDAKTAASMVNNLNDKFGDTNFTKHPLLHSRGRNCVHGLTGRGAYFKGNGCCCETFQPDCPRNS